MAPPQPTRPRTRVTTIIALCVTLLSVVGGSGDTLDRPGSSVIEIMWWSLHGDDTDP